MNKDDLIGSEEAARRLGVNRATFNRWVTAGHITPAVQWPGKRGARLFHRDDVARLAAKKAGMAA